MSITIVCDFCRSTFNVNDTLAGATVECKVCQTPVAVPRPEEIPEAQEDWDPIHPAFRRDRFLLRQQHLAISEKYDVCDESGRPILYVERPALLLRRAGAGCLGAVMFFMCVIPAVTAAKALAAAAAPQNAAVESFSIAVGCCVAGVATFVVITRATPKRHVHIYASASKSEPVVNVLQDHKFAVVNATYTITDPLDNQIGRLHKNYLYNVIRKRWYVYGPDDAELAIVKEDSIILSLSRRFLGPLFGLLRTNFVIIASETGEVIGEFNRKFTLLDRYVLDLTRDSRRLLDRRLAVALSVMLDAGERR
jgi:uncharacterized protein YxjI